MNQIQDHSSVVAEVAAQPADTVAHQKATIVGPCYQLIRYSESTEKADGSLGTYNPDADTCYDWPNLVTGGVVDLASVRLFIDDALLQYFNDPAGAGDTIKATFCQSLDLFQDSTVKNAVRSLTTNWITANGFDRDSSLEERDVTVGDVARVAATVSGTEYIVWSTVAGFIAEKVAAVIAAATEDPNNISAEGEESSSSSFSPAVAWVTISGAVDLSAAAVTNSDRPDHAYELGVVDDVYTVRVTQAGVVGVGSPQISVTTDSGTDDAANVAVVAGDAPTTFGVKGVSVTIPNASNLTTDMEWEVTVSFGIGDIDPVSGGTYTGLSDTTYIVEVTTGGSFAGGPPEVTVSTTTGVDSSGPTAVTGLDTPIAVGSYGVTIEFTALMTSRMGLYLGDKFYITVTAASAGAVRTILLNHNLPNALIGLNDVGACGTPPDLSLTLYIQKDIEVTEERTGFAPLVNWEADSEEICVADGIIAYDSTWVDDTGEMLPLSVKGGDLYVEYRALKTVGANVLGSISTQSTSSATIKGEVEAILGPAVTQNPLSLGTYLALLNAGVQEVYYISVETDNLAGYTVAAEWLEGSDVLYSVVPMSTDASIRSLFATHVDENSGNVAGRWRSTILVQPAVEERAVVTQDSTGNEVLATIEDDPASAGLQYTYVETSSDVDFITAGVQAGDILRTRYVDDGFGNVTYSEYVIDSVLAANALLLVSGPSAPITEASKIEIWHTLTTAETVTRLLSDIAYDNERVIAVWPDLWTWDGETISGVYLAAVIAGTRSTLVPQRPVTDVELLGVEAVTRTTALLTPAQRDQLTNAGITVVDQLGTGEAYCRRGVTTDTSELKKMEEVMVRNADATRYAIADAIAPFKGVSNLVNSVIAQITTETKNALDFLLSQTQVTNLGAQILAASTPVVSRDTVLLNRLTVSVTVGLPYPFGELELVVVV